MQTSCPMCGYCPTCGRQNINNVPQFPNGPYAGSGITPGMGGGAVWTGPGNAGGALTSINSSTNTNGI